MARLQGKAKVLASPDRLDQTTRNFGTSFGTTTPRNASKNLSGEHKNRSKPKHLACSQASERLGNQNRDPLDCLVATFRP